MSTRGALAILGRRIRWRTHWMLQPNKPFVVRSWWDGMTLTVPQSGSAATAFYRTFPSEAIFRWMLEILRPGMTVIDVGAHVGVYSLLAARLVGSSGVVHAIEPQAECVSLVGQNADANHLGNLRTHHLALGDTDGPAGLVVDRRRLGGVVRPSSDEDATPVPALTLASFAARETLARIDLLKLDAAGNELAVLRGARRLLEQGGITAAICKLYHPRVIAERFGNDGAPRATVEFAKRWGFVVCLPGGILAEPDTLDAAFSDGTYSVPALAVRRGGARC